MSASNHNWVCFDCRSSFRQGKTEKRVPVCGECGTERYCLGYKVEVPKKTNESSWRKLREDCREFQLAESRRKFLARLREIRAAKLRIARLEKLEPNKDRDKIIRYLKKKIGE